MNVATTVSACLATAASSSDENFHTATMTGNTIISSSDFRAKVFTTVGQVGIDPRTGQLKNGARNQAQQALANVERQLEKVQASLGQITGMNVFVADEKDIGGIEKALCEILGTGARRYQVVGFPNGAIKLELMVMARARNAGGVL